MSCRPDRKNSAAGVQYLRYVSVVDLVPRTGWLFCDCFNFTRAPLAAVQQSGKTWPQLAFTLSTCGELTAWHARLQPPCATFRSSVRAHLCWKGGKAVSVNEESGQTDPGGRAVAPVMWMPSRAQCAKRPESA